VREGVAHARIGCAHAHAWPAAWPAWAWAWAHAPAWAATPHAHARACLGIRGLVSRSIRECIRASSTGPHLLPTLFDVRAAAPQVIPLMVGLAGAPQFFFLEIDLAGARTAHFFFFFSI
jgi:hypothetical protein